jgi:uncharacterized protein (DUF1697 family)
VAVWAAFLRGVNAGGAGRLPMAKLRALLAEAGLGRPETYIQSGNAVFASGQDRRALAEAIADGMAARFGFRPALVLCRTDELAAAAAHPFAGAEPGKVHAFFLDAPCDRLDGALLASLAAPAERWSLAGGVFHLWAPDGIGRSRLAARLHLAVPGIVTARNQRTIAADLAMMRARGADSADSTDP